MENYGISTTEFCKPLLKSIFYSHGPSNLRPAFNNFTVVMMNLRTRINYLRANQGPVFYRLVFPFWQFLRCDENSYQYSRNSYGRLPSGGP
eukprot:1194669-Prorocentrum_minimum.AAC.8